MRYDGPMSGQAVSVAQLRREIRAKGNEAIAEHSRRFFKTGKGEYGEGDRFLGIRVPVVRRFVRAHRDLPVDRILSFVRSAYHEERLFGIFSLVDRYKRGGEEQRARIYEIYLDHLEYVNNWDLIDGSAHWIVGPHLQDRSRKFLYDLTKSKNLWRRRIAIMSTYHYIRQRDFEDTLKIARILRDDPQDLIHKAVGWMLREVGNRDRKAEEAFLQKHYKKMPRTMLRYAIEKLPERRRKAYLNGQVSPPSS